MASARISKVAADNSPSGTVLSGRLALVARTTSGTVSGLSGRDRGVDAPSAQTSMSQVAVSRRQSSTHLFDPRSKSPISLPEVSARWLQVVPSTLDQWCSTTRPLWGPSLLVMESRPGAVSDPAFFWESDAAYHVHCCPDPGEDRAPTRERIVSSKHHGCQRRCLRGRALRTHRTHFTTSHPIRAPPACGPPNQRPTLPRCWGPRMGCFVSGLPRWPCFSTLHSNNTRRSRGLIAQTVRCSFPVFFVQMRQGCSSTAGPGLGRPRGSRWRTLILRLIQC